VQLEYGYADFMLAGVFGVHDSTPQSAMMIAHHDKNSAAATAS
jgi:hypothetical protein